MPLQGIGVGVSILPRVETRGCRAIRAQTLPRCGAVILLHDKNIIKPTSPPVGVF